MTRWVGSTPRECDLCEGDLGELFFDAKTRKGPWGMLCERCYTEHGIGLGVGLGQAYYRMTVDFQTGSFEWMSVEPYSDAPMRPCGVPDLPPHPGTPVPPGVQRRRDGGH